MQPLLRFSSLCFVAVTTMATLNAAQTLLGPTPYLSRADSPFTGCIYLEDFEDHVLDQPGVAVNHGGVTSVVFGATSHDSVDADDGVIDGSGLLGDSYFTRTASLTFTFDASILGGLPTRAGVVWTDGAGTTSFEAFDANGQSLGNIGPVSIADGSFEGETAEDRFFGAEYPGGISAITISDSQAGIEIDHLQYAVSATPPISASETARLGTPSNPDAFFPGVTTGPVIGQTWDPVIDHTSFAPAALLDFVGVSLQGPANVPTGLGTLLILPPFENPVVVNPSPGAPFAIPIPNDCSFVGASVWTQGASFGPGPVLELTNALDLVLGAV